jgi:integrase
MLRLGVIWTPEAYLFSDPIGQPLKPARVTRTFKPLCAAAGVPTIRLHDLRHTHASHLLSAGVPVNVVSARLGHADPAMTLRVYAHLMPDDQERAVSAVTELIYGADATWGS